MLRISKTQPPTVSVVPIVLYLVAGVLLSSLLLPLFVEAPTGRVWGVAGPIAALGAVFAVAAIFQTRRLSVVGERILLKTVFTSAEIDGQGATLVYEQYRKTYWLTCRTSGGTIRPLIKLGVGTLRRNTERSQRIAEALGLPLEVPT